MPADSGFIITRRLHILHVYEYTGVCFCQAQQELVSSSSGANTVLYIEWLFSMVLFFSPLSSSCALVEPAVAHLGSTHKAYVSKQSIPQPAEKYLADTASAPTCCSTPVVLPHTNIQGVCAPKTGIYFWEPRIDFIMQRYGVPVSH